MGAYEYGSFAAPPEPPALVNATVDIHNASINLSWLPSSYSCSSLVYRAVSSNAADAILLSDDIGENYFCDNTVAPGIQYYYWIKAWNAAGESDFSNMKSAVSATNEINIHCSLTVKQSKTKTVITGKSIWPVLGVRLDNGYGLAVRNKQTGELLDGPRMLTTRNGKVWKSKVKGECSIKYLEKETKKLPIKKTKLKYTFYGTAPESVEVVLMPL